MRYSSQRASHRWSATVGAADGADLELPLRRHHLAVNAGNRQPGVHAGIHVLFHHRPPVDLIGADAAVVAALRRRKAVVRPAQGLDAVKESVFLLDAEPEIHGGVLFRRRRAARPGVGRVRRHIGEQHLAHHQLVAAAAHRVRHHQHRPQHAVGIFARRLIGAGAVKAPQVGILPIGNDPPLGAQLRRGLLPVNPDVFSLVAHCLGLRLDRYAQITLPLNPPRPAPGQFPKHNKATNPNPACQPPPATPPETARPPN